MTGQLIDLVLHQHLTIMATYQPHLPTISHYSRVGILSEGLGLYRRGSDGLLKKGFWHRSPCAPCDESSQWRDGRLAREGGGGIVPFRPHPPPHIEAAPPKAESDGISRMKARNG